MYIHFNTTVCVGSSAGIVQSLRTPGVFQYNCLCRFEAKEIQKQWLDKQISIQLFVSVRDEWIFDNLIKYRKFQYNCLCRFEMPAAVFAPLIKLFQYNCLCRFETFYSRAFNSATKISIQLFVSVRVASKDSPLFISFDFNTTVCVGSSKDLVGMPQAILTFQYNCLCRFEFFV